MSKENNRRFLAGIDYRNECPKVCYQTEEMKEPQELSLDFGNQTERTACFCRILSALKRYGRKEDLCAAIILSDLSEEGIRQCGLDACEAGFREDQLKILGEPESIVHFVMHQSNDIWQQRVWLLEFGREDIKATCMQVNKRSRPMVAEVYDPECWKMKEVTKGDRDERLVQFVKERFGRKQVSAVFLTGTDLNSQEYPKSREEICARRRVFLGEQIHARGACIAAGDQSEERPYLFLSDQTLLYNAGVKSADKGMEEVYTIVNAGVNWYEAKGSCEVILLGEPLLEFCFSSMLDGSTFQAGMLLTDLPRRPKGTSRLLVEVHFPAKAQCEVKVTDLGFGELYPSSELYWIETFMMEEHREE